MTDLITLVQGWLPRQRWFAGEGPARLRLLGSVSLSDPQREPGVRFITIAMLLDESRQPGIVYQVPIVIRAVDSHIDARGYIGSYADRGGRAAVVDGPHDPAFARAVLALITSEGTVTGPAGRAGSVAYGLPMPGSRIGRVRSSRVLQGEQSNSSIIFETEDPATGEQAAPVILKLFRMLHGGEHPDATVQAALAAAGSRRVAPSHGQIAAEWPDPREASGRATGHLAFAQEYFAGVEDAWRIALRAAEAGEDFTAPARSLGAATAETHRTLRESLPVQPATPGRIRTVLDEMRAQFRYATRLVPELAGREQAAARILAAAEGADWRPFQRVHGDYHLGQALAVPERGWVLLDFEGEPLRSLADRNAPDQPARDVAGMLRSFDYISGMLPGAGSWAGRARAAFLDGYLAHERETGAPGGLDPRLITAYELSKAAYEVVYEATQRPAWLHVPLSALLRLLGP